MCDFLVKVINRFVYKHYENPWKSYVKLDHMFHYNKYGITIFLEEHCPQIPLHADGWWFLIPGAYLSPLWHFFQDSLPLYKPVYWLPSWYTIQEKCTTNHTFVALSLSFLSDGYGHDKWHLELPTYTVILLVLVCSKWATNTLSVHMAHRECPHVVLQDGAVSTLDHAQRHTYCKESI